MAEIILTPLVDILDILGVAIFALSGALLAAKERQTFVTMVFFALITGVGGGTVRDLLIDAPVFWINDPWVAAVCLGIALAAWFVPTQRYDGRLLDYADGLGLAAYAVLGAVKSMTYGIPPVPAFLMGVITGCVGGIIRDVIAGRPSILMRHELSVTAALMRATYLPGYWCWAPPLPWPAPQRVMTATATVTAIYATATGAMMIAAIPTIAGSTARWICVLPK